MTATTAPVPRPCDRPHGHHDRVRVLVEVDTFNDRAREPTRVLPYALVPHPALPPGSKPSNSSEPKNKAGCTRGSPPTTPTDQAEERENCVDMTSISSTLATSRRSLRRDRTITSGLLWISSTYQRSPTRCRQGRSTAEPQIPPHREDDHLRRNRNPKTPT